MYSKNRTTLPTEVKLVAEMIRFSPSIVDVKDAILKQFFGLKVSDKYVAIHIRRGNTYALNAVNGLKGQMEDSNMI